MTSQGTTFAGIPQSAVGRDRSHRILLPLLLWLISFVPGSVMAQSLLLNEFLSNNQAGIQDADGDYPDWIEIYNPGSGSVDLTGWSLSDTPDDPNRWTMLGGALGSQQYLLIFASGKDRQVLDLNWSLVVDEGEAWRYRLGNSEPAPGWRNTNFDDSAWSTGPAGIGYGDGDDETQIPAGTLSFYMRRVFPLAGPADVDGCLFFMDFDDGFVAYLNGIEIARRNLGAAGESIPHDRPADTWTEAALYQGQNLTGIPVGPELLVSGDNVLAIQVHNSGTNSSDMTAIPFLATGAVASSGNGLPLFLEAPGEDELHTDFRLSAGETLMLSEASGLLVDSVAVPALPPNISHGRSSDGAESWAYFTEPSPGSANSGGAPAIGQAPQLLPPPGIYPTAVSVTFNAIDPNTDYYYTTDGTVPDAGSNPYQGPLIFTTSVVLRILAIPANDGIPARLAATYLVDEAPHLPTVSLIFEPDDFFSEDSGIYVPGPGASSSFPYFGANFWEDWERPVHLEYFTSQGELEYVAGAGVKIFGGWSRGNPQRSLALYARSRYGTAEFDYPFFPGDSIPPPYEALVLRNSGNDWQSTGLRDRYLTGLARPRGIEVQAGRPVEVYLNGAYWGIYNLREKVNEHYLAAHGNLSADDVDLLELTGNVLHGDNQAYADLYQFIETHNLAVDANFETVAEQIDLQNFMDYQLFEIFFDNRDWPGNNLKYWRRHTVGGKWRWILFDIDFGYGLFDPNAFTANTLEFATSANGPEWPNPPWSTLILRKLLENNEFEHEFVLTACDLLNGPLTSEVTRPILASTAAEIEPALPDHFARWGQNNLTFWQTQIDNMDRFAEFRPVYMRAHLRNYFGLNGYAQLVLDVDPPASGRIRVHSLVAEGYPWSGFYPQQIPFDLEAVPAPGYEFSHWDPDQSAGNPATISLTDHQTVTAVFAPVLLDPAAIVINEINYHSSSAMDAADWLELYNPGEDPVDLNGWYLSDQSDENQFVLPALTLPADAFLVLSHDTVRFRSIQGATPRVVGDFDFNLSNGGELVRLFAYDGSLVDSLRYDDESPWPTTPDGNGPTLELTFPLLDNALAESWAGSDGWGTPGQINSRYQVPDSAPEDGLPEEFRLYSLFPNPFNSELIVRMNLPAAGTAKVQIYDLRGREIRTARILSAGGDEVWSWDGRLADGTLAPGGVYLVQVRFGTQTQRHKALFLK